MQASSNSSIPQAGDIYLVKFHPGYGSEFRKYRPAVIVSGKTGLIDPRFALIAPLTTATTIVHKNSEFLVSNNPALASDSVVLSWYLWTIDSTRLIRKLGTLTVKEKETLQKQVRALFS